MNFAKLKVTDTAINYGLKERRLVSILSETGAGVDFIYDYSDPAMLVSAMFKQALELLDRLNK